MPVTPAVLHAVLLLLLILLWLPMLLLLLLLLLLLNAFSRVTLCVGRSQILHRSARSYQGDAGGER
jgi:hypothetical protein